MNYRGSGFIREERGESRAHKKLKIKVILN